MKPNRITELDLEWWLQLAPTVDWIFAKTYAQTAPHSCIVLGRTRALTKADFVRAGAVIRTFGQPGKFYDMTNIYLTSPDGSIKWWTMDTRVADVVLVNQATTERVYGEQNAPSTMSDHHSVYDEIATQWDDLYSPVDGDEKLGLLRLLEGRFEKPPLTLDIGCGTGAVLDLGITTPDRYVGLDPSRAMLNELLIKQGGSVRGVIPKRLEDAGLDPNVADFELIIAAFGAASYLEPGAIRALLKLCSHTLVLMFYTADYSPSYQHDEATMITPNEPQIGSVFGRGTPVKSIGKFDAISISARS